MPKFVIYSTEIGPKLDPQTASPAPATMVVFTQDPIPNGTYEEHYGSRGRGSVTKTFSGAVVQDFGYNVKDQMIRITDTSALTQSCVTALDVLFQTQDGEYYFTDGYDAWKVKFLKPNGFKFFRNLMLAYFNQTLFSYEMTLVVTDHETPT